MLLAPLQQKQLPKLLLMHKQPSRQQLRPVQEDFKQLPPLLPKPLPLPKPHRPQLKLPLSHSHRHNPQFQDSLVDQLAC
jgi:hypothetical protein